MVPWKDQAQTDAGLKREFALAIVNQTSLWCFDMWGGVFRTPETMRVVARAKALWDRCAGLPARSVAQVALVVDPQSARLVNDRNPLVAEIYQGTRNRLNRLGAPYEIFSFNDLARLDLAPFRLLVFPGLFEITPEKEDVLRRCVCRDGRSVLFVYAPGVSDGRTLDPSRVKALTGTDFGTPGVAAVDRGGWTALYASTWAEVTPHLLKQAAAAAGAVLYCEDEAPVFANDRLVAVHMAAGGEKVITLPAPCREVRELFTGRTAPVTDRRFRYRFATPDTALFELIE